jgi:hypothetical protein
MFLDLSQEEQLSGEGFESRDAGLEISRVLAAGPVITTQDDFEEIMLDPMVRPVPPAGFTLSGVILQLTTVFANSTAAPTAVEIRRERFTVVDAALIPQRTAVTLFEARTSLKAGWMVVPEAEAAHA